jgi:hypothetical protein
MSLHVVVGKGRVECVDEVTKLRDFSITSPLGPAACMLGSVTHSP